MKKIMFAMSMLLLITGTALAQEPSANRQNPESAAVHGLFTLTNEIGSNFRGGDNFLFTYNYVITPGMRFRNDMTLSLPISGGINGVQIESQYYGAFSFTPNIKIGLKLGYDFMFEDNSVMSIGATFGGTVFAIDYKSLYYDINIAFGDSGYGSNQIYGFGVRYYQGLGDSKNYFCLYASFGIRIK